MLTKHSSAFEFTMPMVLGFVACYTGLMPFQCLSDSLCMYHGHAEWEHSYHRTIMFLVIVLMLKSWHCFCFFFPETGYRWNYDSFSQMRSQWCGVFSLVYWKWYLGNLRIELFAKFPDFLITWYALLVERMEGAGLNSCCISWGNLINLCHPWWTIREKEAVLQCVSCLQSSVCCVWVATARWAALEVVLMERTMIAPHLGTTLSYQVNQSAVFNFFLLKLFYQAYYLFFTSSAAYVLPSREALHLGDRVIIYLPRCADTDSEVRKISAEVSNY